MHKIPAIIAIIGICTPVFKVKYMPIDTAIKYKMPIVAKHFLILKVLFNINLALALTLPKLIVCIVLPSFNSRKTSTTSSSKFVPKCTQIIPTKVKNTSNMLGL